MMNRHEIAEYAINELKKAGADKAACTVSQGRKEEFNIEANNFSLLRTIFNDSLSLKAIQDGRKGVAMVNKLDKESIDKAVADCISLASSSSPDEAEDIAEKIENKSFDQSIGGADMNGLFNRTKDFLEQVQDEYPKIVLNNFVSEFNIGQVTYLNTNGVHFDSNIEFYDIGAMFAAKDGEKSTSFNHFNATLSSLDKPFIDIGLNRSLLEESVKSLDTRMVDGKFVGKVLVTPTTDVIWDTLLSCFLSDAPMIEGTSRWKDSLGEKVADRKLTFGLSPHHPSIVGSERFTADGYESHDFDLIKDGVLNSFALSLYGSRKTGMPRAKNLAQYNLVVSPGDKSLEDMIKSIDRGILLNRFSGAMPSPSGDVSGVAKNSFMIENGKITDALSETTISFNIVDILQDIPMISKERSINGIRVLPWSCFDGITISGK
jgi:PmbA protein